MASAGGRIVIRRLLPLPSTCISAFCVAMSSTCRFRASDILSPLYSMTSSRSRSLAL